jgi:hypothetical protein
METEELVKRLGEYPALKKRVEELLAIVQGESNGEEILRADDAEERVIEAVRGTGQTVLQHWAEHRSSCASEQMERQVRSAKKDIKKKSIG